MHEYPHSLVELVVYDATIVSGEPKCLYAKELRYATVAEMRALPFCAADLPLLDALERLA